MEFYDKEIARATTPGELREAIYEELAGLIYNSFTPNSFFMVSVAVRLILIVSHIPAVRNILRLVNVRNHFLLENPR